MRIPRSISLITVTALLTAAATVGQPQSTTTSSSAATSEDRAMGTTGHTATGTVGTTGDAATGTSTGTTTGTKTGTTTTGSDTSSTASSTMGSSGSLQAQDAEFLRKAMASGREEVQNAQLAMQQAKRSETRSAASMMLQDHQRSNEQLQSLAQRNGWPTDSSSGSAQSDQSRGSLTPGSTDFDSRYISEEIRHHREAIADFRKQTAAGSDPDLRRFATDELPQLEHHLEMLESANTGN